MKIPLVDPARAFVEASHRNRDDRWDEMWEGIVHVPPMPNRDHQDLASYLEGYLRRHWAKPNRARVHREINVAAPGGWPAKDYRVPDLVLLTPARFHIDKNEYFEGGPDIVIEIHSPGDESYEKLPFYARLGVPEVWIIHRDTKLPEVYLLTKTRYRKQRTNAGSWVKSPATGVEMRATATTTLAVRLAGDDSTKEALPED